MGKKKFVIGVVLGVSLAVAAGSVEAREKRFHAHFAGTDNGTSEITFPGTTPGADYIVVAGKSTLGTYTAQAISAWELDSKTCTPPDGGSGVEISGIAEVFGLSFTATGEQLFLNLSPGQVGCCSDTGVCTGQITFDVSGGTGRFAGATGTISRPLRSLSWRRRTAPPAKASSAALPARSMARSSWPSKRLTRSEVGWVRTHPTALSIQPAAPVGISREAWYLLLTSERNGYEERQQHTCYLEIEETNDMIAAKLKGTVTKDYRLELKVPRSVPPGEVEVIVLHPEPSKKPKSRARKLNPNIHPAAGLWADRPDIGDTGEFVSQLRRRLETRHDARR